MTRNRATEYDVARQEFLALYPNRVKAILRPKGCKNWVSVSKHWRLSDEQIIQAVSQNDEQETVFGCRWSEFTRFAVFDIDSESKYHNAQELPKLSALFASVDLKATVYRSSDSGGWHVYLFFADWVRSEEVQRTLKALLYASGYEIQNGILEVFPSGNGLRLPLQQGFGWLDAAGDVLFERKALTTDEALRLFINDLNQRSSNWEISKTLIQSRLDLADRERSRNAQAHEKAIDTEGFEGLFSYRLIPEKYQDGRKYWLSGLTAKGQRHDAIMAVEHFLWHGDPALGVPALPGEWNDEARYRLILAWLKQKHNGFCNHINKGNWRKVESQITRCVKWRRPSGTLRVVEPYPMTERLIERLTGLSRATGRIWSIEDLKKGNEGREGCAREKISAALEFLLSRGMRVGRNELARLSGCSVNTVRRHRDIWLLFSTGSGDLNSFVDLDPPVGDAPVASVESKPKSELKPEVFIEPSSSVSVGFSRQTDSPADPKILASGDVVQLQLVLIEGGVSSSGFVQRKALRREKFTVREPPASP